MTLARQNTTQRDKRRRHLASALLSYACLMLGVAVAAPVAFVPASAHAQKAALDALQVDGNKPMLDYEAFKSFFWDDETNAYMENPRTEKPFTEQEVRMLWTRMLNEKPELKPYLEGKWDLLPGELRHLSDKTIQDIESTFHGLLTLQIVPTLSAQDLARDGRRVARVFQSIGPDRMRAVVASINKMDYYEMEVMFQAMGTSVEKLRPLLKDQAQLRTSLQKLPESNLILQKFGGTAGLMRLFRQIKLPSTPAGVGQLPSSAPLPTRHAAYGPGGIFGVSAMAFGVLMDDGIPIWNPADGTPPPPSAINPTVPYTPPNGDYSYTVDSSNIPSEPVLDPGIPPCGAPDPVTGLNNTEDCAPDPVEENLGADNQPAACPAGSAPEIQEQSGCPSIDISAFQSFSGAITDANAAVNSLREKGVGDLDKMESELNLLSQLSQYSSILHGYPDSLNKVKASIAKVDKFAALGGAILDARVKVGNSPERAAFDLLYVQHRRLLGSMRRATEGATMIDKLGIANEIANFGSDQFRLPFPAMRDSVAALNLMPKVGTEIDKMQSSVKKVSGFCLNLPSRQFITMLNGITSNTKSVAGSLPKFPSMGGFVAIIQIITKIEQVMRVVEKIVNVIKTVQQIMEAITVVKQIIDISKDISSLQNSASQFSEAGQAMEKLKQQGSYGINPESLDAIYTSIDSVNKKVAAYKEEQRSKGTDVIDQQDKLAVNNEVERKDYQDFMDTFKALNQAMNTPGALRSKVGGDWEAVQSSYNEAKDLLSDDLIGAFRYTNLQANAVVDISTHFDASGSARAGMKMLANEMPRMISKMNAVPNIKDALDKMLGQMGKVFAKLDRYRGNICVQVPNYTVKFCIAPFTWPISQSNLYMIIGRLLQDNRYKNARMVGAIPFDYNKGLLNGLVVSTAYRVIEKAVPFGVEPVLRGVAGTLPSTDMKALDTPAVSPLELNQGWLYRRACPRDWKTYTDAGLFTDEFNEKSSMFEGHVKTTPNTGATEPLFARAALIEPTIRPDMTPTSTAEITKTIASLATGKDDSVPLPITCAPIKPAKCDKQNPEGCFSPLMRRLMVDACANQYITSQSLEPFYIQDNDSKPGITSEFCQPLFLQPQNLCMKDIRGNCIKDPVRGVVRHEYDAYMYLVRSWVGTQVNAYLPDVHFPIIYDKHRMIDGQPAPYADWTSSELEAELKKSKYKLNPDAMIVPAGIDYYYDQDQVTPLVAKKRGWRDFFDKKHRWQMDDLITHPYEVIVDVTHPFSPRWDFETNERAKYSRCTTFPGKDSLSNFGRLSGEDKEICGSPRINLLGGLPFLDGYAEQAISFDPWTLFKAREGSRKVVMEGTIACAGTPVDILRFREKNFDDCIMCRVTTNERCLWSEVTQVTLTSIIITVIREVVYWVGYAICAAIGSLFGISDWLGKRCGKLLRRIVDMVLFDPMGHNDVKDLMSAPLEAADRRCSSRNGLANVVSSLWWESEGCRTLIEFYQSTMLILRAGDSENTRDIGANPYDTGLYRLITNSADSTQFSPQAAIDFYKYQNMSWRKSYRNFRKEHRTEWIEALRPLAEEYCPQKMKEGKSPTKCAKAKRKLKKGWKGAFKRGKKATFKGFARMDANQMQIPFFCKTDRTKQARKMWPPCSTRYNEADRDENFCKKGCAVSITDCCNELARPLTPLNKLRLAGHTQDEDGKGKFGEGLSFTEYFGTNRPYMAMWDTGSEWGASGPRKDQIDYYSASGAFVHVVGVGRGTSQNSVVNSLLSNGSENSCKIGGWGKSLLDPKKFGEFPQDQCIDWSKVTPVVDGKPQPNPLTSWTELKLYQARTFRYFRLNCIGQYEKLFKPYTMEDIVLKAGGGSMQVERGNQLSTIEWPLSHRGFLWDPNEKDRFPNFGVTNTNKRLVGLNKAQPGDIVYLDATAYQEAYPNDPDAGKKYAPMMGIITSTDNGMDLNQELGEQKTNEPQAEYTVDMWQANSGINPDSCGITEMAGYGRTRTIYRTENTLRGKNPGADPTQNRFTVLENLQQATPKMPVYTTQCQLDPMLRYCTFEDTKANVNLWDHVRIYRPKQMDYRGGCKVRRTADAKPEDRVDINDIPLDEMYRVPEDDIGACMREGRDPPTASQGQLSDTMYTSVVSSLCAPGYAGRSSMLRRVMPLGTKDPMAKLFPVLSRRSDLRAQGCPRFANDTLVPLKVKVKANLNMNLSLIDDLKSVHDRAMSGYNGLSTLYSNYRNLPKTTWSAAQSIKDGKLLWMPCGGGIPLIGQDKTSSADAPKSSWKSMTPPYASVDTHGGDKLNIDEALRKGNIELTGNIANPIKLYAPPLLERGSGSGTGNEEQYMGNMLTGDCPGFSIPGLKGDEFNVVIPPCLDAKKCSTPTGIKTDNYDKSYGIALANGGIPMDGKMTITTPKDTIVEMNGQKAPMTMTFPNGVSFRHECKQMVTLNGYNKVTVWPNGKLKVIEGETKDQNVYYPIHNENPQDPTFMLRPLGAVVFPKGLVAPLNPNAKVIPAINVLPSALDVVNETDDDTYKDLTEVPDTKPRYSAQMPDPDGEDSGLSYEKEDDTLDSLIRAQDAVTNDMCHEQDTAPCIDGIPPAGKDREDNFSEGGFSEDACSDPDAQLECAQSQGACAINDDSDACTWQQEDPCTVMPLGKACVDQKAFCLAVPDYYVCKNGEACKAKLGDGEKDDWNNCYFKDDVSCPDNPSNPVCAAEQSFCDENPDNFMCGGEANYEAER